jgi:hypothetical protein
MGHIFKVYEIFADGNYSDINKTITVEYPEFKYNDYGGFNESANIANIISKVLDLYGFKSKYDYLFSLRKVKTGMNIETNIGVHGAVWYLKQSI